MADPATARDKAEEDYPDWELFQYACEQFELMDEETGCWDIDGPVKPWSYLYLYAPAPY